MPDIPIDRGRLLAETSLRGAECYLELPSTQDRGQELAATLPPDALPTIVTAERQSSGRGRGGNQWWTGDGSLAFSLLFDAQPWGLTASAAPERSLAAAVAIVEAIAPLIPGVELGLHWPNDVFAGGRKLSGLLLDVLAGGRHILGVGMNVNNSAAQAPAEVQLRATSLRDIIGRDFDRTTLLALIVRQIESVFRRLAATPLDTTALFDKLCLQKGRTLRARIGDRVVAGVCVGVAADGALRLATATGEQRIYSATLEHDMSK